MDAFMFRRLTNAIFIAIWSSILTSHIHEQELNIFTIIAIVLLVLDIILITVDY